MNEVMLPMEQQMPILVHEPKDVQKLVYALYDIPNDMSLM